MSVASLLQSYGKSQEISKKRQRESEPQLSKDEVIQHSAPSLEESDEIPHFLIIGVQKAGTMAAVKNMNKHPDIEVLNEVHFFDLAWNGRTVESYRSSFSKSKKVVGEKTPELVYVDECIKRMHEVCPHAKFLLFLRNPVDRAYSSWNMTVSKKREEQTFEECVNRNLENLSEYRSYGTAEFQYIQRGFYIDQIERFLKIFPDRSKLHIVISERIRANPEAEYRKIFEFLGVPWVSIQFEDDHEGYYGTSMSGALRDRLYKLYAPYNRRLFEFLGYEIEEWSPNYQPPINRSSSTNNNNNNSSSNNGISSRSNCTGCSDGGNAGLLCAEDSILPRMVTTSHGDLAIIGRKHGTDKVTHHGYHRYYPRFLEHFRLLRGGALMEIGIEQQKSLQTWLDYFPQAFIYGMDISVEAEGSRYKIFRGDQSSSSRRDQIVELVKHPVFAVIDDGSHIPEHQIDTFAHFFLKLLMPGGVYIIEDVETSYWTKNGLYGYRTNYGFHHRNSVLEVFKDLVDDINREFLSADARQAQERRVGRDICLEARQQISSITFGQNCIIIAKKTVEEHREFGDRLYRYARNL